MKPKHIYPNKKNFIYHDTDNTILQILANEQNEQDISAETKTINITQNGNYEYTPNTDKYFKLINLNINVPTQSMSTYVTTLLVTHFGTTIINNDYNTGLLTELEVETDVSYNNEEKQVTYQTAGTHTLPYTNISKLTMINNTTPVPSLQQTSSGLTYTAWLGEYWKAVIGFTSSQIKNGSNFNNIYKIITYDNVQYTIRDGVGFTLFLTKTNDNKYNISNMNPKLWEDIQDTNFYYVVFHPPDYVYEQLINKTYLHGISSYTFPKVYYGNINKTYFFYAQYQLTTLEETMLLHMAEMEQPFII